MSNLLPTQTKVKILKKHVIDGVQYEPVDEAVVLIDWVPTLVAEGVAEPIEGVTTFPQETPAS